MKTVSNLYKNAKRATVKEVRDLRIGDIIECYYEDAEIPTHEFVVQTTLNNKEGYYCDIRTIRSDSFGQRSNRLSDPGVRSLNTDKFKRVGNVAYTGRL